MREKEKKLLEQLHMIAWQEGPRQYGLPLYSGVALLKMLEAVQAYGDKAYDAGVMEGKTVRQIDLGKGGYE